MKRIIVVLTWVVCLLGVLPLTAQDAAQTRVNYTDVLDEGGSLRLGLYFTVTDSLGRAVPDVDVEAARIVLDDGSGYDAEVEQPNTPLYIVLLLDASGSMQPITDQIRLAASEAIDRSPDQARLAVVAFNEQMTVLQEFTRDRNRAKNALLNYRPIISGTCIYDALYGVMNGLLQSVSEPAARRAIILFSDGRDERTAGHGDTCSSQTYDDALEQALHPGARTSIHTIGVVGGNFDVNRPVLEDMSGATGGFAAIGAQANLNELFGRVMGGLRSQWRAAAQMYPAQGQRVATLIVTLRGGRLLQAGVANFTSPRTYTLDQAAANTPVPPSIQIRSLSCDARSQTLTVEAVARSADLIRQYRFDLKDAGNNRVQSWTEAAPLPGETRFAVGNLAGGQYTVTVFGFGEDGDELARSNDERCAYTPPTATPTHTPVPTQPTPTPLPVGANLNDIQYDAGAQVFRLYMRFFSPEQLAGLSVKVSNARTGSLEATYNPSLAETAEVSSASLPPGEYNITVIALDSAGQELSQSSRTIIKPEPTPTPAPTATETLVPVALSVSLQQPGPGAQDFVVGLDINPPDSVSRVVLNLINESGFSEEFTYTTPPFDVIEFPLSTMTASGKYTLTVTGLDDSGAAAAESSVSFIYNAPPTPTPEPTPAPPVLLSGEWVEQNQGMLLPGVVVIIAALVLVLVILLRGGRKKTGTPFLADLSGAQPMSLPLIVENKSDPIFDPEKTNALIMELPAATLGIEQSPDKKLEKERCTITHVPFRLGRHEENDLNIQDKNVTRFHAEITHHNGLFYITDKGTTNGTQIDGKLISPNEPEQLNDGVRILLGKTTILEFRQEITVSGGFDPLATNV